MWNEVSDFETWNSDRETYFDDLRNPLMLYIFYGGDDKIEYFLMKYYIISKLTFYIVERFGYKSHTAFRKLTDTIYWTSSCSVYIQILQVWRTTEPLDRTWRPWEQTSPFIFWFCFTDVTLMLLYSVIRICISDFS